MKFKPAKDSTGSMGPGPDGAAKPFPKGGGSDVLDMGIYNNPNAPTRGAINEQKKKGGAGWIQKAEKP